MGDNRNGKRNEVREQRVGEGNKKEKKEKKKEKEKHGVGSEFGG